MAQNAEHLIWSEDDVYAQLEGIMVNIHKLAAEACEKYGLGYDLVKGANIAGFERVAKAMMLQGIV
jgi:glutamate dehydrogenase (NADP+)